MRKAGRQTSALLATSLTGTVALLLALSPAPAAAACPNEALREAQGSTRLPACRAYERVSPPMNGIAPHIPPQGEQEWWVHAAPTLTAAASSSGEALLWDTVQTPPDGESQSEELLSRRTASGWQTVAALPPLPKSEIGLECTNTQETGPTLWNAQLSEAVFIYNLSSEREGIETGRSESRCATLEPLAPGGIPGLANIYLESLPGKGYRTVTAAPPETHLPPIRQFNREHQFKYEWSKPYPEAATPDLSHIVFQVEAPLDPSHHEAGAEVGEDEIYEWEAATGAVRLVSIQPDGKPAHRALLADGNGEILHTEEARYLAEHIEGAASLFLFQVGKQSQEFEPNEGSEPAKLLGRAYEHLCGSCAYSWADHAINAQGTRIFFIWNHNLYVRVNHETTVEIAPGKPGTAPRFLYANEEGTKVFFLSEEPLTENSHAKLGDPELYLCELPPELPASASKESSCNPNDLKDLSAEHLQSPQEEAKVLGMAGASQNGGRFYFAARAILTPTANPLGEKPQPTVPKLYLWQEGAGISFIANLAEEPNPYVIVRAKEGEEGATTEEREKAIAEKQQEELSLDSCDYLGPACIFLHPERSPGQLVSHEEDESSRTSRVSADGNYLAFESVRPLTGFNNKDARTGRPDSEVYLYNASADTLVCVSCFGGQPTGPAILPPPTIDAFYTQLAERYPVRALTENGTVFFETRSDLTPEDHSSVLELYAYENGSLHLLSGGDSQQPTYFLDATT